MKTKLMQLGQVEKARSRSKDLSGQVFGRLTAIARLPNIKKSPAYLCKCSCGAEAVLRSGALLSGNTRSCGCLKIESQKSAKKHGMTHTPEYNAWAKMWGRTSNPRNKNYALYKNRRPPESWRDFGVFFSDVGLRPSAKHSLDRINNDLPYGPGNCRWATSDVQHNNTSSNLILSYQGKSKTVAQWAADLGISPQTLYSRLKRGFSTEEALTKGKIK